MRRLSFITHISPTHVHTSRLQWLVTTTLLRTARGLNLDWFRMDVDLHLPEGEMPADIGVVLRAVDWSVLDDALCGIRSEEPILLAIYDHYSSELKERAEAFIARRLLKTIDQGGFLMEWANWR